MKITEKEFQKAIKDREDAVRIINTYTKQEQEAFSQRLNNNPIFTDDELLYSAVSLCPCGHGLAYPKDCGPNHYWDCAAILKGIANKTVQHTARLPFPFYDIKGESEARGTTRGIFRPQHSVLNHNKQT